MEGIETHGRSSQLKNEAKNEYKLNNEKEGKLDQTSFDADNANGNGPGYDYLKKMAGAK